MELKNERTRLGARIIKRRKRLGLTQEELATKAGVKVRALADIERGETINPRTDTIRDLADVLKISIDYLLGRPAYPLRVPQRPKPAGCEPAVGLYDRTA